MDSIITPFPFHSYPSYPPHLSLVKGPLPSDRILFSGRVSASRLTRATGAQDTALRHETAFFREPGTLQYVVDYLQQHFPHHQQVNIFGCSTGEEVYTYAMLQHGKDTQAPCTITGYDIGPEAIKMAETAVYPIHQLSIKELLNKQRRVPPFIIDLINKLILKYPLLDILKTFLNPQFMFQTLTVVLKGIGDHYLAFTADGPLTPEQKHYQGLFNTHFEEISKPKDYQADIKIPFWFTLKTKFFQPKASLKNRVRFKEGDVLKMDQQLKAGQSNAIIFRNALYHLTTTEPMTGWKIPKDRSIVEPVLERLVKNVHTSLADNGLFVIGTHPMDHEMLGMEAEGESLLAHILKREGFEPVRYDDSETQIHLIPGLTEVPDTLNQKVPSVWRKLPAIELKNTA